MHDVLSRVDIVSDTLGCVGIACDVGLDVVSHLLH